MLGIKFIVCNTKIPSYSYKLHSDQAVPPVGMFTVSLQRILIMLAHPYKRIYMKYCDLEGNVCVVLTP